jgi:hypothetical protein
MIFALLQCKSGEFDRAGKKSEQWFHRSVQPFHTFLSGRELPCNIASKFKRITSQWENE